MPWLQRDCPIAGGLRGVWCPIAGGLRGVWWEVLEKPWRGAPHKNLWLSGVLCWISMNFCPPLFLTAVSRADFQRCTRQAPLHSLQLSGLHSVHLCGGLRRLRGLGQLRQYGGLDTAISMVTTWENDDEPVDGMKCPIFTGTNPYLMIVAFVWSVPDLQHYELCSFCGRLGWSFGKLGFDVFWLHDDIKKYIYIHTKAVAGRNLSARFTISRSWTVKLQVWSMLLTSTYSLCETLVENKEQIHARVTFTFWAQSWKGICSLDGRVLTPWFQRRVQHGTTAAKFLDMASFWLHARSGARNESRVLRGKEEQDGT